MSATELRPLSLGEILDVAIKIYWRNAAVLLGLVVLVARQARLERRRAYGRLPGPELAELAATG